jgi:hypothetical protein
MREMMRNMDFDDKVNTEVKCSSFSWDGIWPFDSASNISKYIMGRENENGLLPPGIHLTVRVQKRDPLSQLLITPAVSHTDYFTDATTPDDGVPEITWDLKELFIVYKSYTLSSAEKMAEMRRKQASYFVDLVKLRLQTIPAGLKYTSNKIDLPAGTRWVAITWLFQSQLFYMKDRGKNLCAKFQFAPNSTQICFSVNGKQLLFDQNGLQFPGTTEAHSNETALALHAHMVKSGLYSGEFHDLFPSKAKSYDQTAILSVKDFELKNNGDLVVDVKYNNDFSKEKYFLCYITCQQAKYTYTPGAQLKFEVIV